MSSILFSFKFLNFHNIPIIWQYYCHVTDKYQSLILSNLYHILNVCDSNISLKVYWVSTTKFKNLYLVDSCFYSRFQFNKPGSMCSLLNICKMIIFTNIYYDYLWNSIANIRYVQRFNLSIFLLYMLCHPKDYINKN